MKCFICEFLLLFVCLQHNFSINEAADECQIPGGARGECVSLAACAQYVVLLKESTTTELGLKLTQERRCGLERNGPKVCCPTETAVPNPGAKFRDNLDDADYVDQLPEPGICGRHIIAPYEYVWTGKPAQTPLGYGEAWVKGKDPRGVSSYDTQYPYPTQSGFATTNNRVRSRRASDTPYTARPTTFGEFGTGSAAGGKPVIGHGAPYNDGSQAQPTFDNHGIPTGGGALAAGGTPVIGHGAPYNDGSQAQQTFDNHGIPTGGGGGGVYVAAGGSPVIGHGAPYNDGSQAQQTFDNHGIPTGGGGGGVYVAAGGSPVIGHEIDYNDSSQAQQTFDNHGIPTSGGGGGAYFVAGGSPVIGHEMAQWMALLAYKWETKYTWECGGSIITKRHVLTAAHCVRDYLYVVRVGELDLAKTEKEFNPIDFYIKKKIPHEQYTPYHNDIAILVLDGTIPYDDPSASKYLAPICLPEPGFPYQKDGPISTFITGWGLTEKDERPTNLLYAYLDILEQTTCGLVYSRKELTIDERVFCAGDPSNGRDACNGDSGGPLVGKYFLPDYYQVLYYQLGLISYGYRCSAQRFTGVYTNITHFMPWILEKVTGNSKPRPRPFTTPPPFLPYENPGKY